MTKYLTLDIETRDDYISLGLGAGWVYKLNYGSDKYKVIGVAVLTSNGDKQYITEFDKLHDIIQEHDVIIGHNLSYDLGGLYTLGLEDVIKDKPILDTYVMSKLYDSSLMNYDLDFLSNRYLNKRKNNQNLVDAVRDADVYPWLKRELNEKKKCEKKGEVYERILDEKKVLKWSKSNMETIQTHCFDTIRDYAIQDVVVTKELFKYFQYSELYEDIIQLAIKYSYAIHVTNDIRKRGIRVDLNQTRKAIKDLQPILTKMYQEVYDAAGIEFNLDSAKQLAPVFHKLGIHYHVTPKGNPSFKSDWMKKQPQSICAAISKIRSYRLVINTFIKKTLSMQQLILGKTEDEVSKLDYGFIYPELHLLRAKTGRFSSTSPNIQQIPKRDEVLGPICRAMFVPYEGETWYSADYSNQEGRLHLHFAHLLGCVGTQDYVNEFIKDAKFDTHKRVASLCGIDRPSAKTIYLGKSYGMGGASTCHKLGLPTRFWKPDGMDVEIEIAGNEGKALIDKFNTMIPYLVKLSDKCTDSLRSKNYIKTIGDRKLRPEVIIENKKFKSLYYRALSLVSQGSGADQIIFAMIDAYNNGIKIVCAVHDELNISSDDIKDAEILKRCMYSAVTLVIPQYIDVGSGLSWQDAK